MKEKVKKSCATLFLFFMMGILSVSTMYAQGGSSNVVNGTVLDSNGESIIGASVLVKGSATGTVTDLDGKFQLNAPANATLVISYIGYKAQEVAVAGQKNITIRLADDSELLSEVVVIGYGTVKKDDATGSVVAIKAEEMNKGLTTTASDLLAGKVAGLNITSEGGEPGAKNVIRIRGGSSLSASNDPLIVIDGIPMNSDGPAGLSDPISALNPNDIETFTVLKDASATAIYGSRASNGVIIITTKKGKAGQKLRVSYSGNVSFSQNQKKIEVLSGNELRNFLEERYSTLAEYSNAVALLGESNTDWQDEIFRTGVNTDHNVSVFGSIGQYVPFRASIGYTNQNGTLKTSNFERVTGSISLTPSLLENHLNISVNAKGTYADITRADANSVGAATSFDPTQSVMSGNSNYNGYFTWTDASGLPTTIATKNPLAMLEDKQDLSYARTFVGNTQFDYKLHFFPDLKFNLNLGLDYSDSNGKVVTDPNSALDYANGGYNKRWTTTRKNELIDFYTQYVKDVTSIYSKFDVMGGYSWQHFHEEGVQTEERITKLGEDGLPEKVSDPRNWKTEYYLVSFFGRFNYTLLDRYLMTFTLRSDGSSRFSEDNRWGLFPSLAAGWKMKEENFLKDVDVLSDLKLRLGWGITGQQNIGFGNYAYQAQYKLSEGQAYYLMGYNPDGSAIWIPVLRPETYNPDLKWEKTYTSNVGVDFGFLNNRITGSLDYYYRKTKDLINEETKVASGANFGEYVASNIGTLTNQGLEFSIQAKPIVTRDFTWDLGYNIAWNKSKITKLNLANDTSVGKAQGWVGGDGGTYSQIHSVGHAPFSFYLYEQVYDENGKPLEGVYVDQNNDGVIDEKDKIFFKKPAPDVTMGFNSKWTYKQWDLGFNARVSLGNYVYNGVAASGANTSFSSIYSQGFISNVRKSALETNFQSKQLLSSYYVQNASFLKLDNVTLGYTLPNIFGAGTSGRVFGSVQNLFTITPYDGLDPEITKNNGIDYELYPRSRSFIFGVNLNF